jgi:hypothetical protein
MCKRHNSLGLPEAFIRVGHPAKRDRGVHLGRHLMSPGKGHSHRRRGGVEAVAIAMVSTRRITGDRGGGEGKRYGWKGVCLLPPCCSAPDDHWWCAVRSSAMANTRRIVSAKAYAGAQSPRHEPVRPFAVNVAVVGS